MKKLVTIVFLLLASISAHATVFTQEYPNMKINPYLTSDSLRSIAGGIMTLVMMASGHGPTLGAVLNVTQEEIGALMEGDVSYVEDVGTGEAGPGLATPTYDYIDKNILTATLKTPYAPLNNRLSSGADYKAIVQDMFFIPNAAEATEQKQQQVLARRTAYLTALGRAYTQLAYGVHGTLISDMHSVAADINGNGSIGATAGADQTWHAINRALIADIAMQIQLMELDAAKFLSVQPLILMTEAPPTTTTH